MEQYNQMTPGFYVVPGSFITDILAVQQNKIIDLVRDTYLSHHSGFTINPDSYFLRFDDKPNARIIALPAAIKGDTAVAGIKWIASYPDNANINLQRASAALVLNDYETGYPIALLEASQISAARTAASCVLAADVLTGEKRMHSLSILGAGLIARTILDYLRAGKWTIDEFTVHALNSDDAEHLAAVAHGFCDNVRVVKDPISAIRNASHVVLATTASSPYIHDMELLEPGQIVLNISLRDLAPELLLAAFNVLDDIEHCMKAGTSPHLAEQLSGGRSFVHGVLAEVINGTLLIDRSKPIVFSPFGLGILDLAVGRYLLNIAREQQGAIRIDGFFPNVNRW
jgi:2,3-diaminopropionate biosynthesis protein SbnB